MLSNSTVQSRPRSSPLLCFPPSHSRGTEQSLADHVTYRSHIYIYTYAYTHTRHTHKHYNIQHVLQFACLKAGLTLYTLDPSLATTNPTASKEALSAALKLTQANILITQEAGDDTNYIRLVEDVIPELRIFNTDDGMPFLAPNFPHLRLAIHAGFDYTDKMGMVPLSDMLCPVDDSQSLVDATGKEVSGTTPLLGELELGQDGVPTKKGKVMTNDEVVKSGVWPEFSSILKKEYREVEGVGVIF